MAEQGKRETACVADAPEPGAKTPGGGRQQVRTIIGHFSALDVVPHAFDWIQVRRVGWEPLDLQPVTLACDEIRHDTATMCGESVPDQDHTLLVDKAAKLSEEGDQAFGIEAASSGAREQTSLLAVPAETESPRHGGFVPVIAAFLQDRRLSARCPRCADRRLLAEPRFVLEEDPGVLATSVFFSSGQRC